MCPVWKTLPVLLVLLGGLFAAPTTAQDKAKSKDELMRELRTVKRELDGFYSKCKYCDGRGEKNDRRCRECDGEGRVFDGDCQKFIDKYLVLCDLMDAGADVLAEDEHWAKRFREHRDAYLRTIRNEVGPQQQRRRSVRAGRARYREGEIVDGQYNVLARRLTGVGRKSPIGHGIAFEGKVVRFLEHEQTRLAEVRIECVKFASRTCHVLVPTEAEWKVDGDVCVVGRIIEAVEVRKALALEEDAVVVKPCYGTR